MKERAEMESLDLERLSPKLTAFLDRWMEHDVLPMLYPRVDALCSRFEAFTEDVQRLKNKQVPRRSDMRDRRRALDALLQEKEHLTRKGWSDGELAAITDETLATEAFQLSQPLRVEFSSLGTFLGYWRGTRAMNKQEASR